MSGLIPEPRPRERSTLVQGEERVPPREAEAGAARGPDTHSGAHHGGPCSAWGEGEPGPSLCLCPSPQPGGREDKQW